MDVTTSLKRRRPYPHEGDDFESYHQPGPPYEYSSSTDIYSSSLSSAQQQVLQNAAEILNIPSTGVVHLTPQGYKDFIIQQAEAILDFHPGSLSQLSYQSTPEHQQKRLRSSSDNSLPENIGIPMGQNTSMRPTSSISAVRSPVGGNGYHGLFALQPPGEMLRATASGMVSCFSSFTTCPTMSPTHGPDTEYQPMSTTTETGYYVPGGEAGMGYPHFTSPDSVGYTVSPAQPNLLTGDGTDSVPHMEGYPALRPDVSPTVNAQLTSHQPLSHSQGMYYPSTRQHPDTSKIESMGTDPPMESIPMSETRLVGYPTPPLVSVPGGFAENDPMVVPPHLAPLPTVAVEVAAVATTSPGTAVHASTFHEAVLGMGSAYGRVACPQVREVVPVPQYAVPRGIDSHQNQLPVVSYGGEELHVVTQIQISPRAPAARRGPFKDPKDRQKTAETRKKGSCIRCRMQRIRCNTDETDEQGPCLGCKKTLGRAWRLPCLRLKISDIALSKTCQVKGHEWTLRWKENSVLDDVGHWASNETRTIHVTEGYTGSFVALRVRRFIPQDGDSLMRSWVTEEGEPRSVKIPPYAVVEPEIIMPQYNAYIKKGLVKCCNRVLNGLQNTMIWPTYCMALAVAQNAAPGSDRDRRVISTVLELWMTVRLTTKSFEIVGEDTLGMRQDILDETNPSSGRIPLPPVMGAQLDSVLIHKIQTSLRAKALDGLQKLLTEGKAKSWLTSYLAIFILLHNAALVIRHDASYAKKHGIDRRYARQERVQEYYTGAITLLSYFHYCNKGIFPFTPEATDHDIRNIANLDDSSIAFVHSTRQHAIANQETWKAMRANRLYEDDFYFISQLFERDWKPEQMVI